MLSVVGELAKETPELPKNHDQAPPQADAPEHMRAKWWRENIAQMSRSEVAEAVGVSVSRIVDIEEGRTRGSGAPIDHATMTRYRMACAALTLGVEFDWMSMSLVPDAAIRITLLGLRPKKRAD